MKIHYLSIPEAGLKQLLLYYLYRYLVKRSDVFSLVYYLNPDEPLSPRCIRIRNLMSKLLIAKEKTTAWPGNSVENMNPDAYYEIEYYTCKKIEPEFGTNTAATLLDSSGAQTLSDWDFPEMPMDLCFYRNGMCWFSVVAHENIIAVYTENEREINELLHLGDTAMKGYEIWHGEEVIPNPILESVAEDKENKYVYYIPAKIMKKISEYRLQ